MKKSKKKLVINISSHAHNIKNYNNINLNEMNNWEVYKFSKVCLILLSKKLAQKGIKSISINPGRMRTNFGNQFFGSFFIKIYLYVMGKNPINIAEKINTIIKSGNFKNGHYYSNFKKTNPSISAINTQKIMKFLNSFKS